MNRLSLAVLDACVLAPMPLADTLLRLAEPPGLYSVRWSDEILVEVQRTLTLRLGRTPEQARRREQAMRQAFPGARVLGYEGLIAQMTNQTKDRHVLAAAVACGADYVVTLNRRDFSEEATARHGVRVIGPSQFLIALFTANPEAVRHRLAEQADTAGMTMEALLARLAKSVPAFVEALR